MKRLVLVIFCLMSGAPLAFAQDRARFWGSSTKGVGQFLKGDLKGAVETFTIAKNAWAQPELDALVAMVALQGGKPKQAERQLDSAIAKGSRDPLVFYWASRAALANKKYSKALSRMEQAITIGGDLPMLRMGHAILLASAKKKKKALESLIKVAERESNLFDAGLYPSPMHGAVQLLGLVLKGFPNKREVLRTQGYLFWQMKKYGQALDLFVKMLSEMSDDADALQMVGRCLFWLGQDAQGWEMIEKAVVKSPKSGKARAARGEFLLKKGKASDAVKDLRFAADLSPRDSHLLTLLAEACGRAEDSICAKKFYSYAIVRDTKNARAYFGLAVLNRQAMKNDKAKKLFATALSLDPNEPDFYEGAAMFFKSIGDKKAAQKLMAQGIRMKRFKQTIDKKFNTGQRNVHLMVRVLRACECGKEGCLKASEKCLAELSKLPSAAKRFFKGHLALRAKNITLAQKHLVGLVNRLSQTRLLVKDPTLLLFKKRLQPIGYIEVRRVLPMVPSWAF